MCGIVGFTGSQAAAPLLLDGLRKLEYRGYDSAGIAVQKDGALHMIKASGHIDALAEKTQNGALLPGWIMSGANQEHGILSNDRAPDADIAKRFPVGTQLRILPNHACATGAQFPEYHALHEDGTTETWPRFYGW